VVERGLQTSGKVPFEKTLLRQQSAWALEARKGIATKCTYMRRQVFPQAPSPTITSLRRISAMLKMWVESDESRGSIKRNAASDGVWREEGEQMQVMRRWWWWWCWKKDETGVLMNES